MITYNNDIIQFLCILLKYINNKSNNKKLSFDLHGHLNIRENF